MVVAGAGLAQRVSVVGLAQGADRPGGGQAREALERLGDPRAGQPVVAVPARRFDPDQAAFGEPAQVSGDGGGRDTGLAGQRRGAERPAPTRAVSSMWPLVAICVGYFMVILDTTVVNVALPALSRGLHTTTSGLQWVIDGYSLTFAALLLSAGALGDRRGAKLVFQTGLAVFVVCSLACGLAPATGWLIAARAAQGVGAALCVPASLALLQAAYPDRGARRRAFADGPRELRRGGRVRAHVSRPRAPRLLADVAAWPVLLAGVLSLHSGRAVHQPRLLRRAVRDQHLPATAARVLPAAGRSSAAAADDDGHDRLDRLGTDHRPHRAMPTDARRTGARRRRAARARARRDPHSPPMADRAPRGHRTGHVDDDAGSDRRGQAPQVR
jgi:hypothetical protein